MSLVGPIRGRRLDAETKLALLGAIDDAKGGGMPTSRACEILQIDPRRVRRWKQNALLAARTSPPREAPSGPQRATQGPVPAPEGRAKPVGVSLDMDALRPEHLADRPPVARRRPHAITEWERAEIARAGREAELAEHRHRKLTHHLSRAGRVFVSPSTTLRVLRAEGLVPVYIRRSRPARPRTEVDEGEPNRSWRYDLTTFPTTQGDFHLAPVLDGCSRKITGRAFGPAADSLLVQEAWEKALATEGLLADEGPELPLAVSDRGTQMTSRSTKLFFFDLGVTQSFSRPRTPTDNASCEAWMATLKCECLYTADTAELSPDEVLGRIDRFIAYYNEERLHQSLDYVTPSERHEGRHVAILEARRRGMEEAKEIRREAAYGGDQDHR